VTIAKVPKYAVALVLVSGIAWVVAGVVFGGMIAAAYSSHGSLALAGVGAGYPTSAATQLVWDQFYINLYTAVIGLFAVIIGVTGFRNGERWAWYAMLVFILNGLITGVFDYLSWGGWYTSLVLAPAMVGLVLSKSNVWGK